MPIYQYQCLKTGEIAEKLMPISAYNRKYIPCPIHTKYNERNEEVNWHDAEKIWSLPAKSAPIDDGKGLVYFENEKGHVEFSSIADKDKWQPHGYQRKEARNLSERLTLERKLRRQDNERLSKQREQRDIQRHYSEQVRHSDLRNSIQQGEIVLPDRDEQGRRITVKLDDKTKSLLKRGMERTNKRKQKRIESEIRLSVNHESASTIRNKK